LPFVFYVLFGAEVENSKTKYTTHMDFIKVAGHNKNNIRQQKQKQRVIKKSITIFTIL
jgi:hypothetical protein